MYRLLEVLLQPPSLCNSGGRIDFPYKIDFDFNVVICSVLDMFYGIFNQVLIPVNIVRMRRSETDSTQYVALKTE